MASIRATHYLLSIVIVLVISAATAQDTDIYGNPVSSDQGSYGKLPLYGAAVKNLSV